MFNIGSDGGLAVPRFVGLLDFVLFRTCGRLCPLRPALPEDGVVVGGTSQVSI